MIRLWAEGRGISLYSPIIEIDVLEEARPFKGVILRSELEKKPCFVYRGQIKKGTTVPVSFEEVVRGLCIPNSGFASPSFDAQKPEGAKSRLKRAICPNDVAFALPCVGRGSLGSEGYRQYFYCHLESFSELDEDLAEEEAELAYEAYVASVNRRRMERSGSNGCAGIPKPGIQLPSIPWEEDTVVVHAKLHKGLREAWNKQPPEEVTTYRADEEVKVNIPDPHQAALTTVVSIPTLSSRGLPLEVEGADGIHFFFGTNQEILAFDDWYKSLVVVEEYAKYCIQKNLKSRKDEA